MSTQPRLEARVSALERRQTNTETHIEEVNGEITTEIKHLSDNMEASFDQLTKYLIQTVEADITDIKADITDIKATMATKEDITDIKADITDIKATMATMENRILDAFRQLAATINPQRPPAE